MTGERPKLEKYWAQNLEKVLVGALFKREVLPAADVFAQCFDQWKSQPFWHITGTSQKLWFVNVCDFEGFLIGFLTC